MTIQATFTADISDFRRSMADAVTVVNGLQRTTSQVNSELRRFGNDFSGANVARRAETMARAIRDVGGVSKLTNAELKRAQSTIQEYVEKFDQLGKRVPSNIQQLSIALRMLTADEKAVAVEATKAAGEVSRLAGLGSQLKQGLFMGLGVGGGVGLAGGIAQGMLLAGQAIKDLAAQGQQLSALSRPFEALQGGAGRAAVAMEDMRRASLGLVGEVGLLQAANKAALLGLNDLGLDMGELSGVATRLGRAMGLDATTAIDNLTTALGRQSVLILDNLGITMKAEDAYAKYARSIGKSATDLTEQEKRIAWVTEAMTKARMRAAELGDVTLTVADQWNRLSTLLTDAGANLFSAGNEAGVFTVAMDALVDAIEGGIDELAKLVDTYGKLRDETIGSGEAFSTAGNNAESFYGYLAAGSPQMDGAIKGVKTLTMVLEGYRGVLLKLRGQLDLDNEALPSTRNGDIKLPDMTMGAGPRARAWLAEEQKRLQEQYIKDQEAALRKIEQGAAKGTTAVDKFAEALKKVSGKEQREEAELTARAILKIGAQKIPGDQVDDLTKKLQAAAKAARETGQAIGGDVKLAIERLVATPAYRKWFAAQLTNPSIGTPSPSAMAGIGLQGKRLSDGINPFPASTRPNGIGIGSDLFDRFGVTGIQVDFQKGLKPIRDYSKELGKVSDAFAKLSQITGGSLDGVNRFIGTLAGTADASKELVAALSKSGAFKPDSTEAKLLGGGLAGLGAGASVGRLTTNRAVGAFGGAAAGAATGLSVGGPYGALAGGIVGGLSGLYTAGKNRRAQLAEMESQRQAIIAQYGTMQDFKGVVERAGWSFDYFLSLFNSSDPDTFRIAVTQLNSSIAEGTKRQQAFAKSLQEVARVQGVISAQQVAQIRTLRNGDAGVEAALEFDQGQRNQIEEGLARAVAVFQRQSSLTDQEVEDLTRGISDKSERERVLEQALKTKAGQVLKDFGAGVRGAAAGLYAAFSAAIEAGEDALTALQRLQPSIQTLQDIYKNSGQTPGAGLQQMQSYNNIASGPAGASLQVATGLGSALSGLANTGLLSPELFAEIAAGIGQAYRNMELLGQGGIDAARLMQPALQSLWQLTQDNPEFKNQLDEQTRALLDFAEKSGLVGDKFRPAIDRMVQALDKLIERFDAYLARLSAAQGATLPDVPAGPGAGSTGGGGSTGSGNGGDPPPFANGSGGVRDFGRETLVRLHGREAVLTEGQYKALLAGVNTEAPVIAGLGRLRGSSGGGSQTIVMQLGRQTLARAVVQDMPKLVTLYGGA